MKSYDPACKDLAEHFLFPGAPSEEEIKDLAQCIQDAVELWFVGKDIK